MFEFNYKEAFSRNIGLVNHNEQNIIKDIKVALPGMGGVGGANLITLVRLGFEKFNIADFDSFELKNINRQYGAAIYSLEKEKTEIMKEEALKINPKCQIKVYNKGIDKENLDDFLEKVDFSIDCLDAFEVETRRDFINKSIEKRIPLISAGPIGYSSAYLIFQPGGMNFDQYFGVKKDTPYDEKLASFFVGLNPKFLPRHYMKNIKLKDKKGPSSIAAVNLCAGVTGANVINILFGKEKIMAVPYYHQFDALRNKYVRGKYNHKNLISKLKKSIVLKMVKGIRDEY